MTTYLNLSAGRNSQLMGGGGTRLCYALLPWDTRPNNINLLDETETMWLQLWHRRRITEAAGFHTELWITVENLVRL